MVGQLFTLNNSQNYSLFTKIPKNYFQVYLETTSEREKTVIPKELHGNKK